MDGIERFEKLSQEQKEYVKKLVHAEIYDNEDGEYYMMDLDELLDELEDELQGI